MTVGCAIAYRVKNLTFELRANYDDYSIEDTTGFNKYITHFMLYSTITLPKTHNLISGILGYQASIFRIVSIRDSSLYFRKSGYAPLFGCKLSVGFKSKNNYAENADINSEEKKILCNAIYQYSPNDLKMRLIRLSVDLRLRDRSGAIISLNIRATPDFVGDWTK